MVHVGGTPSWAAGARRRKNSSSFLATDLRECSCWKPMPADLPPVAANGTHLACYVNHQTPKHPNWPTGNLGRVASTHRFQGWSCVPNKQQAAAIVQIHIKIDDQPAIQMEANISRPDLRGKTPCLGAEERHGFIGEVPAQFQKGKHTMSAFAIIPCTACFMKWQWLRRRAVRYGAVRDGGHE